MSEDLDVSMKCVKYMLFISNFLFVMVALLLISIGTLIKAVYTDFEYFLESSYFSPSDMIILSGFIIFFVAFFGCWGAIKESTMLVNVYGFFLFLILILEVVAAVVALTMRFDLRTTITTNMENVFNRTAFDKDVMDVFDFTQSQLFCCGVNGQNDWKNLGLPQYRDKLPQSCCPGYDYFQTINNVTCFSAPTPSFPKPYEQHCGDQVTELISQSASLLSSGAFCVVFIQVIGIIFARMLSKTIRTLKTKRLVEADLRRQQIYSQIILGTSLNGECKPHTTAATEA